MTASRKRAAACFAAALAVSGVRAGIAQTQTPTTPAAPAAQRLPLAPVGRAGNAVFPALEGWWKNADGTVTFLIGYYNRNEGTVEIPVGPNNHIDPGGPDLGQPTVFLPRRQYGVFAITVPKDFGTKRLTWTLSANGQPTTIALWINAPYVIDPFRNASNGNTPPRVKFDPNGAEFLAAPKGFAATVQGTVGTPVTFTLWATDAGNTIVLNPFAEQAAAGRGRGGAGIIRVTWSKYRGPGSVKFDPASQSVSQPEGKATATATFSVPGEYVVRAQVNDSSGDGGGGDQCCWTTAHVKVVIK